MIWATVSSWSCFCWLYWASPSLAAENIINLVSVFTIWWCSCVESSLLLLEDGVPRLRSWAATESARLRWHRNSQEELPHIRGQGQRLCGATPSPSSGGCPGAGGPRRAFPSLAAKNIIKLISVLTICWCSCVESSLVLLEEGVCYDQCIFLAKLY